MSRRAYSLFQARGSEHGHDLEDWLAAEAGLIEGKTDTALAGAIVRLNRDA